MQLITIHTGFIISVNRIRWLTLDIYYYFTIKLIFYVFVLFFRNRK